MASFAVARPVSAAVGTNTGLAFKADLTSLRFPVDGAGTPVSLTTLAGLRRENTVMVLNPALVHAMDVFTPINTVVLARDVHFPTLLCDDTQPDDQSTLQDPRDRTVPCSIGGGFTIATVVDGTGQRKWVEFRPGDDGGFVLEVHLARVGPTDPQVKALPPDVPLTVRCFLQAQVQGAVMTWDFDTVAVDGMTWTLTLHLKGDDAVTDRDRIYTAMTTAPYAALIVRRSLSLAVRVPTRPLLYAFDLTARRFVAPQAAATAPGVPTPDEIRAQLLQPAPAPAPAAPNPALHIIRFPFPNPPMRLPGYRVAATAIDSPVAFAFIPALDQAVFSKLPGIGSTNAAALWNQHKLFWQPDPAKQGRWHVYYQDRLQPLAIYFLPDEFRVQRRPETPHRPWLSLSVVDDGAGLSLGYIVVPVWDAARIDAAMAALRAVPGVPAALPPLQPFAADHAVLRLKLPKGDAGGGPGFIAQPSASIQTDSMINGNVTLSVDDFRPVFEAIVHDDSDLFNGAVDVTIDGTTTSVPVTVRAATFAGPVLDMASAPTPDGLVLTFRNGIESPVQVTALPVDLYAGGQKVPSTVSAVEPAFVAGVPTSLPPTPAGPADDGAAIRITLARTAPPDPSQGELSADWDDSQVVVEPDGGALLDAILDTSVDPHSMRAIEVNLPTAFFESGPATPPGPVPSAPAPPVLAIQVEFEAGPTAATFRAPAAGDTAPLLTQSVQLRLPLRDFLSGNLSGTNSNYVYRVRRVYATSDHLSGPVTDSRDVMFVQLPPGA